MSASSRGSINRSSDSKSSVVISSMTSPDEIKESLSQPFIQSPELSPTPAELRKKFLIQNFIKNTNFFGSTFLPLSFLALVIRDYGYFLSASNEQFDTRWYHILTGLDPYKVEVLWDGMPTVNSNVWSAHLGSSFPGEILEVPSYWLATAAVASAYFVTRLHQWSKANRYSQPITRSEIAEFRTEANKNDDTWLEWFSKYQPYSRFQELRKRIEFVIEHSSDSLDPYSKGDIANTLTLLNAQRRPYLSRYYEKEMLAKMMRVKVPIFFRNETDEEITDQEVCYKTTDQETWHKRIAEKTYPKSFKALEITSAIFQWYTIARLLELVIIKSRGLATFYSQQRDCKNAGKIFAYVSHLASYACTLCGDWQNVYPKDVFSSQGCLDASLLVKRSEDEVIDIFKRAMRQPDFTRVDLSEQDIYDWPTQKWKELFLTISNLQELVEFNISTAVSSPIWLDVEKLDVLANFLRNTKLQISDLTNVAIGSQASDFYRKLQNVSIEDFRLSNTGMGSSEVEALAEILPTMNTKKLSLSRAYPSRESLDTLMEKLEDTQVTALDISMCDLDDMQIEAIARKLKNTRIVSLDLSGNTLTENGASILGAGLVDSHLEKLVIAATNLTDPAFLLMISFIQKSSLKILDVSHNHLQTISLNGISKLLLDTLITDINLSNNEFSMENYTDFLAALSRSNVRSLNLSGNRLSKSFMGDLAEAISQSKVEDLDISNCELNDDAITSFTEKLREGHPLKKINASHNNLTSVGGNALATILPGSEISELLLSHNMLDDLFGQTLARILHGTKLRILDLAYNLLTIITYELLTEAFPKSSIETALLDYNRFDQESDQAVANFLITPTAHSQDYSREQISYDEELELASKAKPNTNLTRLSLNGMHFSDADTTSTCRILPMTQIPIRDIGFTDSSSQRMKDQHACRLPSAIRIPQEPNAGSYTVLSLLGGALLFYLFYKLLTSINTSKKRYSPTLFKSSLAAEPDAISEQVVQSPKNSTGV